MYEPSALQKNPSASSEKTFWFAEESFWFAAETNTFWKGVPNHGINFKDAYHKLADPAAVIAKYSELHVVSKILTLATNLAYEAFFATISSPPTLWWGREYNGLAVWELNFLNKLSSTNYQSCWTNPVEFAPVWAACVGCQCGLPVLIPSGKLAKDFAGLELHYMYVLTLHSNIDLYRDKFLLLAKANTR